MILPMMEFVTDGEYEETKQQKCKFENYIYLKINDKIFKLGITVDYYALKIYIKRLTENLENYMFTLVDEEEMKNCCFPIQMEYVGKFKLNKKRKSHNYRIPNVNLSACGLIYVLNAMYNKDSLDKEDLYNLEYEKSICDNDALKIYIINDVISKLNIVVMEEYDYNKLAESVEYISDVTNKEKLWNKINLKQLKTILLEAEENIERFKALNLYDLNEFVYPNKKQKVK